MQRHQPIHGHLSHAVLLLVLLGSPVTPAQEPSASDDVVMQAMLDELDRSMTLQLADLEKPYFLQYTVTDSTSRLIRASYGAIVSTDEDQRRVFQGLIRVGDYALDNTNFAGGGGMSRGRRRGGGGGSGRFARLPLDDDYRAIRHAIWLATDQGYKSAVETLAEKRAYMEDKRLGDRPDDFARISPTEAVGELVVAGLDRPIWEERLRTVSARFAEHDHIDDGDVELTMEVTNRRIVSSEGTRVRDGDVQLQLAITAETQAEDGDWLADGRSFLVASVEDLPPEEELLTVVDTLAERLQRAREAVVLDLYTGPVLFEGVAAPQLFHTMLASGVAGQADPVGTGRRRFRGTENLERQLGRQILPESFSVHDDPIPARFGDEPLAGHYLFDLEGVPAERVHIVVEGRLVNMAMSRVPTARLSGSNGHGRSLGRDAVVAGVGCLYVEAGDGLERDQLLATLLEEARNQGLEYAVRVTALDRPGGAMNIAAMRARMARGGGGGPLLSDPIYVYRINVEDGSEEPVRGCEFGALDIRDLEDIVATGATSTVYNHTSGGPPVSVIAPPVILEEVQLSGIQQELEKQPLLEAPHAR